MDEYKVSGISYNLVMVQPTAHITNIGEWVLFDVHEPSKHFTVKGTVLQVPDRLFHAKKHTRTFQKKDGYAITQLRQYLNNRSLEYDTEMELQVGDEVVFQYTNHSSCMADGLYWYMGQENPALFINYDQIYMIIRDGKQILPNGWVWVEPIAWTAEDAVTDIGEVIGVVGKPKPNVGIVRNFGKPNAAYLYEDWVDADDLKMGDTVVFKQTAAVCVEWYCHKTLNDGNFPYFAMQRHDIYAIVVNY